MDNASARLSLPYPSFYRECARYSASGPVSCGSPDNYIPCPRRHAVQVLRDHDGEGRVSPSFGPALCYHGHSPLGERDPEELHSGPQVLADHLRNSPCKYDKAFAVLYGEIPWDHTIVNCPLRPGDVAVRIKILLLVGYGQAGNEIWIGDRTSFKVSAQVLHSIDCFC